MQGLSERAYATHAGLSRGAVKKARKTGRLVLFADGSINAAASDARRAEMTDPDQQRRSLGAAERSVGTTASSGGRGAGGRRATVSETTVPASAARQTVPPT